MFKGLAKLADAARKQQDIKLYKQWKESGNPEDFRALYTSMKPYIGKVTGMFNVPGVTVPRAYVNTQAKKWFHHAVKNYKPDKGDFHGYVSNTLNKVKSQTIAKQTLSRIPETRAYDVGRLQRATASIEADKGTAHSSDVAKRLGWKEKKVRALQQETKPAPLTSSLPTQPGGRFSSQRSLEKIKLLRGELSGKDRELYDLVFTEKVHSTGELAKRLGVSPATVSRIKNKLFTRIKPLIQTD